MSLKPVNTESRTFLHNCYIVI